MFDINARTYLYVVFIHGFLFKAEKKIFALPFLLFQLYHQSVSLADEFVDSKLRFADRLLHLFAILNIVNDEEMEEKKIKLNRTEGFRN